MQTRGADLNNKSVAVGFSGGKDSSAAILLLKKQKFLVSAVTMTMGLPGEEERIRKISELAAALGVPFHTVDVQREFSERVKKYFVNAYSQGITPNPCLMCNNHIKFNLLKKEALKISGAQWFATGHYARLLHEGGRIFLTEPVEKRKSQIYFMAMVGPKMMQNVLFPLGGYSLEEVKNLVSGLDLAGKGESQDVCFLQGMSLWDYLKQEIPGAFVPGQIIDVQGNVMGTHQGAVTYTIGQRRGIRFAGGKKLYVVSKDMRANTITLGEKSDLESSVLCVKQPVYWRQLREGEIFAAKIRYQSGFSRVEITEVNEKRISARFTEPVQSVTPGQLAVFYLHNRIAAAGIIA